MLTLTLLLGGSSAARAGQVRRLPRQSLQTTAAVTGIITTEQGLGLGGVTVILQNLTTSRSLTTASAGDGSFRFVNLVPGRYQLQALRDSFLPFAQGEFQLAAGDVFPLMFTMKAASGGSDGIREIPRQPGLGPKPPPTPQEPATSSTYRNLPAPPPPADAGESRPIAAHGRSGFHLGPESVELRIPHRLPPLRQL
jgi:Carboxypeptidase regulatory-like domain